MKRWIFTAVYSAALVAHLSVAAEISSPNAVKSSPDLNWSVTPNEDLRQPGPKTINLSSCFVGVKADEPQYWVYISDREKPEAVLVTGGSCDGSTAAGTLRFTTVHPHAAGYTLGSASSGLQEALIAARFSPQNPKTAPQAGKVVVPPGEYKAYARVSIRASNMTVDFSGSILECSMDDTCLFIGDPTNAGKYLDITVIGPRGRPMVAGGQHPFIEVNATRTRLFSVSTRLGLSGGTFNSYVQVDDDQAFLLDGLDTVLGQTKGDSGVLCNATICNPVIYAPGQKYFAVGWLKHLNLTLGCNGNGIDWESGNSLQVSDSVIQGYPQYGVRAGLAHGGYQGITTTNVYGEVGNCHNPTGNIGQAGIVSQGGRVIIHGDLAMPGNFPQFANKGKLDYRYYIVARHAKFGPSVPLYAGNALTDGTNPIIVTTADIPGAASFDLLRVNYVSVGGDRVQAPNGTGNYAVLTGVSRESACVNGVCTFQDNQSQPSSYTVARPTFMPLLSYWPGSLILSVPLDLSANSFAQASIAIMDRMIDGIVSVLGPYSPAVSATYCNAASQWTPMIAVCLATSFNFDIQPALVVPVKRMSDSVISTNRKGRVNFGTIGTGPGHILTLSDSNFEKTVATANNRPYNDVADAFIGYDQHTSTQSAVGISFGAPFSLSNYIGNAGDGTSWLERLTATGKTFHVPISTNSLIASTVPTGTAPLSVASTTPVANLTVSNHPRIESCGTKNACAANALTNGQIVFGNVALSGGKSVVSGFKPGFTSAASFQCTASDMTKAGSSANAVPSSATGIAIAGEGNDVISYICVGN